MTETLPMLTPQEVAKILGVHQKTVHLWLRNGSLQGIKLSYRAWRIPQSSLDQFIEQRRNGMPQSRTEAPHAAGMPDSATPEHSIGNPEESKVNMKHYLRDIMGEQSPGTKPDT